ncbi:response regulator transcription factor [Kitasatospora sp. NPDC002040]|uniref:response regulator transcription factor n=1 Tax=Kitasatospora sp. NPDC002040 TaxID=3154661 RepID=UPI00332175E0
MTALTSRSTQSGGRGHRAAVRRHAHLGIGPAVPVEALQAEIDNPLDLIAGHQLLTDPAARRAAADPHPAGRCDCGHPVCGARDELAEVTRVFVMERHPVASAGLRSVLATVPGLAVVGSTGDPAGAVAAVRRTRPDVILLGRGASLGDDLAAVAALRGPDGAPEARVLLLRRAESTTEASRILLAGASGCFPIDLPEDRIIGAVQLAAAGGSVFLPAPPSARVHPASLAGQAAEPALQQVGLTGRERDVLAQLARGLSNAEIGRELALAEATVKKHLTQAMRKIGQSDRLRAALYAHRHGLAG